MRSSKFSSERRFVQKSLSRFALCCGMFALGALVGNARSLESSSGSEDTQAESFYQQISRNVIRLTHDSGVAIGSAFFVRWGQKSYLVTARHVAEKPFDLRARVSAADRASGDTLIVELRIPRSAWVLHPLGDRDREVGSETLRLAAVDVAATEVPTMQDYQVVTVRYCAEPCSNEQTSQFADSDPRPPDLLMIFGFPEQHGVSRMEQTPFARLGFVSVHSDELFIQDESSGEYRDSRVTLADAFVAKGNSGAPVFRRPELGVRFEFLGIVSGTNIDNQWVLIEPVSRIVEVLEAVRSEGITASPGWYRIENQDPRIATEPK